MPKAIDDMDIEKLKAEKKRLSGEVFDNEWQYEFVRQEIKEINERISKLAGE